MHLNLSNSKLPLTRLLLVAPFFLWGTAMVAMKGVMSETTPFFVAVVRLLPAGLLVVAIATLWGRPQPKGWLAWLWISLFALVDGTLFQGFLAQGLARTGAGLGSVMIDSQPLAVALLAGWFYREQIGLWGWLGLGLGIAGISLIGLPDQLVFSLWQGGIHPQDWLAPAAIATSLSRLVNSGEFLMLLAALAMAVGTVMMGRVSRYADPIMATGWHMILGGLPLALGSGLWETEQWNNLHLSDWLSLSYATVFGSAIAYGLFFYFAAQGNLTSLSSLTFLTPVFALTFGNLILAEVLTPLQLAGVGLTLVSIYLVNQRQQLAEVLQRRRAATAIDAIEYLSPVSLELQGAEPSSVAGDRG
ncbi:MAG: DMT family transporter [Aphanocapsa sp. GSE-SYN-MK-11-07L]|nr:DMT family transporter [Aphanocapsa sp. GSE-SYN-MK-11-07L]